MKKMRRIYRIGGPVGAIILAVGAVLATGIPEAAAASGTQFCYHSGSKAACLNAWGGGPWVNTYTGGPNTQNNDFTISVSEIKDTGGNAWSGDCIGDAHNSASYADVSLDPCGTGVGTQFIVSTSGCESNQVSFYNIQWNGYLGPVDNWVNGSHFYLNKPTPYCFTMYGAVSG